MTPQRQRGAEAAERVEQWAGEGEAKRGAEGTKYTPKAGQQTVAAARQIAAAGAAAEQAVEQVAAGGGLAEPAQRSS